MLIRLSPLDRVLQGKACCVWSSPQDSPLYKHTEHTQTNTHRHAGKRRDSAQTHVIFSWSLFSFFLLLSKPLCAVLIDKLIALQYLLHNRTCGLGGQHKLLVKVRPIFQCRRLGPDWAGSTNTRLTAINVDKFDSLHFPLGSLCFWQLWFLVKYFNLALQTERFLNPLDLLHVYIW